MLSLRLQLETESSKKKEETQRACMGLDHFCLALWHDYWTFDYLVAAYNTGLGFARDTRLWNRIMTWMRGKVWRSRIGNSITEKDGSDVGLQKT